MSNNNKSSIRFNGLDAEWKTWKIGDILTEKNKPILIEDQKEYQLVTVKRRNEGVVSRGYLKGKNILVKSYFEVEAGDFIISKRQIVHGASGIVPKSLSKAVVSNEYLVASSNESISSEYLTLISKLPHMQKMFFLSSYGVDIEKMVFDVRDWKKRSITIPEINEQKRITYFFLNLDELIAQQKQKQRKLQALKKAMLDKMFPKQGQLVPEIRFKGFDGNWEKMSLGELGNFKSSGVDKKLSPKEIPVNLLNYTDIYNFRKISSNNCNQLMQVTAKPNQVTENNVLANDVFFTPSSETPEDIGKVMVIEEDLPNTVYSYHLMRFRPNSNVFYSVYPNYGFACELVRKQLTFAAQGVQRYVLNKSSFEQIIVLFPSLQEQEKIGNFLKHLDNLIDNHEIQITKLQNIKKAFLAKMFIK